MKKANKRYVLISIYIVLVYLLGVGVMQWAKHHPIVDDYAPKQVIEK